jgi:hypothetical protein
MKVGDKVLIDSPVSDSPFKGATGYLSEHVTAIGWMVYVEGLGDYLTTEEWLAVVEEGK